jgi:hypothetical protein
MDEITDQNQPVIHSPVAGVRFAHRSRAVGGAGKAARTKAGLVTYRVSGPAPWRHPVEPVAARRSRHCSPARPGACSPRTSRDFRGPGHGRADGRPGGADG